MRCLTAADARELSEAVGQGEFVWVDLEAPRGSDFGQLTRTLDIPSALAADAERFGRPARIASEGEHRLVFFRGAERVTDGEPPPLEVHLLVGESYLVTLHHEPIPEIAELMAARRADSKDDRFSALTVLHVLVDEFVEILEAIDDEIDRIEDAIIEPPTEVGTREFAKHARHLGRLRRSLMGIRRIAAPERDLLLREADAFAELPRVGPDPRGQVQELYGRLVMVRDLVDSSHDLVTGALDLYMSTVSNRLNEVGERLTLMATIFLPLTFITGFFGQNFAWMVKEIDTLTAFLIFGVGGLVVTCILLLVYFRRRGYL